VTGTATGLSAIVSAIGSRLDGRPLVIMLDVDGTLAPIAPRPADARVPVETRRVIERLSAAPEVHVALVSGRAAADAMALVGVDHLWALGNHGLEFHSPDGNVEVDQAAQPYGAALDRAARSIDAIAREVEGALVEDKQWTMSLHYRLVDERFVAPMLARARAVAAREGLRVTEGKKVMEVRPPVAIDKGTASVRLAERLGAFAPGAAAFFAGDDRTDEDAFRALRARSADVVTVRVGDEGETAAEFTVAGTDALRDVLVAIVERRAR
jgi:trehalose-phosphatase